MKKLVKRLLTIALALALVVSGISFTAATPAAAADEYSVFVAFGGDKEASNDWGLSYAGGEASEGITATDGKIKVGETVRVGLEFASPVVYTWYTAPVVLAKDIKTAYFSVKTFIDGEEVALDLTAGSNWWYESTGDYADTESIRIAGGYNEWGAQYIAEAPTGFTKLEYEITCHALSTEEGAYAFVAFGGDMAQSGDWALAYTGGALSDGIASVTDGIVAPGKETTIGIEFENPVVYTWYTAPTVIAEGVESADFTVKTFIDGVEVASKAAEVNNWWYESTGDFADTQAIRTAGGYNEWGGDGNSLTEAPVGFTKLEYVITCNKLSDSAFEYVVPTTPDKATTAYLAYADASWTYQYWGGDAENGVVANNATIPANGYGTYTVGLDFTGIEGGAVESSAFLDVTIANGQEIYAKPVVNIDEVKINGEVIALAGVPYTSSDDGVETRVNLFNEWVAELPADARTQSGSLAEATPTAVDPELLKNVQTIEVTFTLIPETQAHIDMADPNWAIQNWGAVGGEGVTVEPVTIYEPGDYSTKISFDTPVDGLAFAALMLDRGESMLPYIRMDITKILVNGEEIAYANGYTTTDDGFATRVNLYNEWVADVSAVTDVRVQDGITDYTPCMIDNTMTGISSIEVFFTVAQGPMPEPEEEIVVEYSGEYGAYLGCQTNTELWIFRNAWDDATYGFGTDAFSGLYSTTSEEHYAGTFEDAVITGDGEYTVKLTGADFQSEDYMSILSVSTSIPYSSSLKFTNISVKINGVTKYEAEEGMINPEDKQYATLLLQNYWNESIKDLFPIMFPVSDIEITFTISGLGYDKVEVIAPAADVQPEDTSVEAAAEPAEDTATAAETTAPSTETVEPEETGSNTVIIVIIIVAAVLVAAALVYFLVIRKKSKK